jgi:hypothetical protein
MYSSPFNDANKFVTEVLNNSKNLKKVTSLPSWKRIFLRLWQLLIGSKPEVTGIRSTFRENKAGPR